MKQLIGIISVKSVGSIKNPAKSLKSGTDKMSVSRATKIAEHAVKQGWKGKLNSDMCSGLIGSIRLYEKPYRETTLVLIRNDEMLVITWINNEAKFFDYSIYDESHSDITSLAQCKEIIFGWPDLLELYALFPHKNQIEITKTYKRIPFDWETATDEEIISKLVGRKVFWYDHKAARIRVDVVMNIKVKSKVDVVQPVGHRKLFNFNGAESGFRSVILDTLLKVA
jgi:hypothetical protein